MGSKTKLRRVRAPGRKTAEHGNIVVQYPGLLKDVTKKTLAIWKELPTWLQDNEHIHSGYRPPTLSYRKCLHSITYLHNETGNIYSHFLTSVWFAGLAMYLAKYAAVHLPDLDPDVYFIFALFFLGAVVCFSMSTLYHIFFNHSATTHTFCLKLDFLGIIFVLAGAFPPGLWFTFPCMSKQAKIPLIVLYLTAQFAAAAFVLCVPRFRTRPWRPVRGLLFSIMASAGFYPIIWAVIRHGWSQMDKQAGASWYLLAMGMYLVSVIMYATRWPEAWRPGKYDIWGHSHQLFHIGVAVGLTAHLCGFLKAFNHFYTTGVC